MAHSRIVTRRDYADFVCADLTANNATSWHWWMRFKLPQVHLLRLLRAAEYWSTVPGPGRVFYLAARLRLARQSQKLGMSIPPGVFGPGLSLPHYGTIVVNDKARFGKFCRIHTSTNIGEAKGEAPIGGDFVYVAPGAVIYGGTRIGDRAAVGANSVVRRDVPSGTTVAGAPAVVVSESGSEKVMPAWIVRVM